MKKPLQEQVPAGTIIVGHHIAEQLKFTKGQSVKLMGRDFGITKIQEAQGDAPDSTVWINLKEAQDMLGMQNEVSAILALECNCASVDRLGEIREEVAKILPGTQVIERGSQALARAAARNQAKASAEQNKQAAEENKQAALENEQAALDKLRQHEDLAALLAPLVIVGCGAWIGVLSLANVRQRAEEIGILRAIGWRSWQIMKLFLGKAVILGLMGAVLGYVVGFAVTVAFGGSSLDQSQLFNRQLLLMTLLLAPLLSAIASWIPALMAARNDPAVILQGN
jgi:ABC-type lipoprotein release transport system permease subunit